jgi:seryl-tRNA synthetase
MAFQADLHVSVPAELTGEFLAKLHYVAEGLSRCELTAPERNRVQFELRPDAPLAPQAVASRIAEVARRLCELHRPTPTKVLHARHDRPVPSGANPHPALEAGDNLKYCGAGRYALGSLPLRLLEIFDRRVTQLAEAHAISERRFPSLIGADTLAKCNYYRSFPHSLGLVSHLREDLEAIEHFAADAHWENDRLAVPQESLGPIKCVLAPAVCFHHYAWLENTAACPDHAITAVGKCFRYESGNLKGLERLWDFTLREIIWVGRPEHVLSQRSSFIQKTAALMDEWGFNYEIVSATDPFFINDYSVQALIQKAFDLKYEVIVPLPYANKGLAVASANYHQDFFGRSLNICGKTGDPIHTGCLGFGLERLALAFLTQYGLDPAAWPAAVRQMFQGSEPHTPLLAA